MSAENVVLSKSILVKYDGKIIAKATSFSLQVDKEEIEISHLQSGGWKEAIGGKMSWSVSADAFVTRGAVTSGETDYHALMLELMDDDIPAEIILTSNVTGDKFYSGKALITSISQSGSTGEVLTYSVSFSGNGPLQQKSVV